MNRATLAIACCLLAATVSADQISVPHPPQSNTQAKAAEMKANLDAIVEESNKQDERIEALENAAGASAWGVTLSGWTGEFVEGGGDPAMRINRVGAHQANELCREALGSNYLAASVAEFSEVVSLGGTIALPSERCPAFVKSYTSTPWYQYASTTGNLNYPTVECENASTIMCASSSGTAPSSLFIFSGWAGSLSDSGMSSLGAYQANSLCREAYGSGYQAASLDSFATAVGYASTFRCPRITVRYS